MPNERIAESARQAQSDFEAAARKADKCEEGLAAQLLRIFAGACGVEATCAEYDDAPDASAPENPRCTACQHYAPVGGQSSYAKCHLARFGITYPRNPACWQFAPVTPPAPDASAPVCDFCDGSGEVDSGGSTPQGHSISVACPRCRTPSDCYECRQPPDASAPDEEAACDCGTPLPVIVKVSDAKRNHTHPCMCGIWWYWLPEYQSWHKTR